MEFRILGPVEVVDNGRGVALGPAKQRAVLVILLLHVNEVVSRDRLVDDLWGERAPKTAHKALHGYVSQLRKLLDPSNGRGRAVLITRAPGYLLQLDPGQIDLQRFQLLSRRGKRELSDGDAQAASSTFAEALSLWRGPPLAEFAFAPFALAESLRLEELFVSTLENRMEADLSVGRHDELVDELETVFAEHPFRERLCGQLMLALYRSGRQAEALEVYRKTRRTMVEELGIEPGPALQQLEQAILRQEQAITLEPARGGMDPSLAAAAEQPPRRAHRLSLRWRLLAVAIALGLAIAVGLAFAAGGGHRPSLQLASNSVGFIDAKSGRVTKSFPVGRAPSSLTVADNSVWVANYRDRTVTRIDRTGNLVTIPVEGHPTGLTGYHKTVWVWTLEDLLVPIDPSFNTRGKPISLASDIVGARRVPSGIGTSGGRITGGDGALWIAAPLTTVIRVVPTNGRSRPQPIVPDDGVQGAIAYRDGRVWVAGANEVFPIAPKAEMPGAGADVGGVRDLAFGKGSLWVVSGNPSHVSGVAQALRRIDPHTLIPLATIGVGSDPVSVTFAGGSVWVASETDGVIERVNPEQNRVVETIKVRGKPTALVGDTDGVWVAAA